MKKIFILCVVTLLFMSCQNNVDKKPAQITIIYNPLPKSYLERYNYSLDTVSVLKK